MERGLARDVSAPLTGEYAPFAQAYVDATARALAEHNVGLAQLLEQQPDQFDRLLLNAPPEMATYSYAPGKWTLAESILHTTDTERVFAYRLMRIARGDRTPLPGFDQDAWVPESRPGGRTIEDLLAEFRAVRTATLALIRSLDANALAQVGTASNNPVSVRALIWMIAGHAAHHISLTSERYLKAYTQR